MDVVIFSILILWYNDNMIKKELYIIAGANSIGKSTLAEVLLKEKKW